MAITAIAIAINQKIGCGDRRRTNPPGPGSDEHSALLIADISRRIALSQADGGETGPAHTAAYLFCIIAGFYWPTSSRARDLAILNRDAKKLNREAADVLGYQDDR